jgi:hypothetical protein
MAPVPAGDGACRVPSWSGGRKAPIGPLKKSNDGEGPGNNYHDKVIDSKESRQFGEKCELVMRTFRRLADRGRTVGGGHFPFRAGPPAIGASCR